MDRMKACSVLRWGSIARLVGRGGGGHDWRWEKGQTLVLAALFMVVLVGALALVIDVGNAYTQRRLVQNAADAGALAGARLLALERSSSEIDSAVDEFALRRNLAQSYELSVLTQSVVVTTTKTFPTFFAMVVGMPTMTVAAAAEGAYGFPGSYQGPELMPIAVHKDAIPDPDSETPVQIWNDTKEYSDLPNGIIANGHRGWLNLDGGNSNATELSIWIINGYGGEVFVGDWINGEPGVKDSVLQDVNGARKGKRVIVPVFDELRDGEMGKGKYDYHIIAFAAFTITNVVDTGNPKYVEGKFHRYVTAQDIGGSYDFGLRVIGLRR